MKKSILTLSLLTLFAVAGKAQDKAKSKQEPLKKETVNPDGTVSSTNQEKAGDEKNATPTTAPKKSGTRMAISEKGTPTKTSKQPKESKEEKTVTPTQPGAGKKE